LLLSLGSAASLLIALVVGLSSCGSSGEAITANEASQQLILGLSDLPPGSKRADKPLAGERCSPASHFRKYAQSVLSAPGFYLPQDQLLQQVGIFRKPSEAAEASRKVLSAQARRCIEGEMQATSVKLTGSGGTITFKRLGDPALVGVTAKAFQLHFSHPFGELNFQQAVMVDDRALTTLTFISENHSLAPNVWQGVMESTAASLGTASSGLGA